MTSSVSTEASLTAALLARLSNGDQKAAGPLIELTYLSLHRLSAKLFRDFSRVHRWEETDDVCHMALMRLNVALLQSPPESEVRYYRMAATYIRRTLIDLARKHFGPLGIGANYDSRPTELDNSVHGSQASGVQETVHESIAELPDDLQEVFDLVWYGGLSQDEAARVLDISVRTLKRRWRKARMSLGELLGR